MFKIQNTLKNKNIIALYIVLFFSCSSLIVINYITIRILSGSRAYVNGESSYSKGQDKASRHLITYLFTENDNHWKWFKEELKIPLGDQKARIALTKNLDENIAKEGLRAGKNKEQDLNDMIWIFKNFNSVPFFVKAIKEWESADEIVNQLLQKGILIHEKIKYNELDDQTKTQLSSEISVLCDQLSTRADKFSDIVGDGSREIKDNLIILNIFFILIIISSVSVYYIITLKKILASENDIKKKKEQLQDIIEDLEKTKIELSTEIVQHKKLIGTISHDIKSPIKYLAMTSKYIYEESKNCDNVKYKKNTKSAYSSTLQLYNFIDSLLTYSKIFFEGNSYENSVYDVKQLIQTKCNLFHEIAEASNNILINEVDQNTMTKINKDILSVIIHNIIDNAIKNTENGIIKIYSHTKNNKLYLVIEDTGKGFKEEDLVYYNQLSNEQSAEKLILRNNGMGLPMIIELIHILYGDLRISNNNDKGSKVEIITDLNL
ncbi:MAG TPA: HAMP domain-containing sensor histidine kinase [Flavobacterium sp.]